jgi:hypothetical protein
LPATSDRGVLVQWSGEDDPGGSGIASYDILVSEDGSNYYSWLTRTTNTSAVFSGVLGGTYWFYSVARDNVGHEEKAPLTADATTTVNTPFTVGLTVESLPTTVFMGSNFNYRLVVANQGPGTATNVFLNHGIDPVFSVVSATPHPGSAEVTGNQVIASFGSLAAGNRAELDLTLTPGASGTFTNRITVACDQGMLATADVIIQVSMVAPALGVSVSADGITFVWPVSAAGFTLEQTDDLTPPIDWHPVTNAPVVVNNQRTLTLSATNSTSFYRLRGTP